MLWGYAQSAVDGWYGWLTHYDVEHVQTQWGLYSDGLVGHSSWSRYDDYVDYEYENASGTRFYSLFGYPTNKVWLLWGDVPGPGTEVCTRSALDNYWVRLISYNDYYTVRGWTSSDCYLGW